MQQDLSYYEKELLTRIAEGDEAAFTAFLRVIVPGLESVVFKIVKQDDAVKEILQETFVRIWLNRNKLPDLEKPIPWLKRVALNETFTWLNKNASQARVFSLPEENITASVTSGFDNLSLRETQKILQQGIELLPPQRKKIYEMSRVLGMKTDEIAQELDLSHGYVKNALTAALEFLRGHLRQAGKILAFL